MWIIRIAWYRTFQFVFNYGARVLRWRKAQRVEGPGSINKIPDLCKQRSIIKPMVVTDPGLMKAGVAVRILDVLEQAGIPYSIYSEVEPNPSVNTVNAIQAKYINEGCHGLIAIGGGSAMDAAKGAGARIAFPGRSVKSMSGLLRVWRKIPPLIAVPTTSGTGSETTIAALITDTETHHKFAIMDLHLIPLYAILDPELTVGLPPHITAATGMDALTHAVEAYLCWTYSTKESTRFAEEAVSLIFRHLERAYKDGGDIEARLQMQRASYLAGFAFTRAGVGNIHAVAHTLGGLYNVPHGLANAVILPIVLEDYGPRVYKKLARLAEIAGTDKGSTEEEKAKAFIGEIRDMNARMGIGTAFDCILDKDIEQMISWASKETNPLYPVPVLYNRARYRKVIGQIRIPDTMRITKDCVGCTACAILCPVKAISGTKGELHVIDSRRCVKCGVCGRICLSNAIVDRDGVHLERMQRSHWPKPVINEEICSACGICITLCTPGTLRIEAPKEKGDIQVSAELFDPKKCIGCGICAENCPIGAITMSYKKGDA
ncbi:hypothetical protein MASR2M70_01080 [Bacillota bacterium]